MVIYSAANAFQAGLLRQLLEENGIHALVVNDLLSGEGGELPLGISTAPRVIVAERDAKEARELAIHFEQQIAGGWNGGESDMIDDSERTIGLWPQCPDCARKRTTVCPYCGTSGVDFPWADEGDPTEEYPELWIECPVCDSVYEPDYLDRCEWCGNRFPSGIKPPQEPRRAPRVTWQWNPRLVIVLLAMAAIMAVVGGYFYWLLRR